MLGIALFILAVVFTLGHLAYTKEWGSPKAKEVFLSYVLFFNLGILGLLAAYAHIFMGPETAKMIGWQTSPFQFEMGMTNLSFGVLGVLSYWIRGRFWDATIIGWSIVFLGCFIGHVMDYYLHNNTAPYNIGIYIWFTDLFLPLLALATLFCLRCKTKQI